MTPRCHLELLTIDSPDERRFYEIEAAANQWAGIFCPVGAQEWPHLEQITQELEGGEAL